MVDDHLRLSESRKRVEERDAIDAAVERLSTRDPQQFGDLPRKWERIKQWEDSHGTEIRQ